MDFNTLFMVVVSTILGWEVAKFFFKALSFYLRHLLMNALSEPLPDRINPEDFCVSDSNVLVEQRVSNEDAEKLRNTDRFSVSMSVKGFPENKEVKGEEWSIEPHGAEGTFALYQGRDLMHHGARLCNLSDFDCNGEKTRGFIVSTLNKS